MTDKQRQANFFRSLAKLCERGTKRRVEFQNGTHIKLFVPDEVKNEFSRWAKQLEESEGAENDDT